MSDDDMRPRSQPAQAIYDAFLAEVKRREGRAYEVWLAAERQAVWAAARDQAQQLGMRVPTLKEVEEAETYAEGLADYGAKWAYRLADIMRGE